MNKFCVNCAHFRPETETEIEGCHRKIVKKTDPVTGRSFFTGRKEPNSERSSGWWNSFLEGTCGKSGRFFKEKNEKSI